MSFDISVFIWTLIDFVLLYLVLNFLLIKPLFKVMDKRKAKVDAAAGAKAKLVAEQKEREAQRAAELEQAKAKQIAEAKQNEAIASEKRKAELEKRALETAESVTQERAKLAKDSEDFLPCRKSELDAAAKALADALTDKEA